MFLVHEGRKIGRMLEEKELAAAQLAEGICSYSTVNDMISGKAECDLLLFFFFWQRLGESLDKKEYILSWAEYQGECIRSRIKSAIFRGRKEWVERAICCYEEKIGGDKAVHRMFVCRMRVLSAYWIDRDVPKAQKWMEQALDATFPRWKCADWNDCLISVMELENLLAYVRIRQEQGVEEQELLKRCGRYIQEHVTDAEEHARIYSKYAWLAARRERMAGRPEHALELCGEAFCELGRYSIAYFMLPLLQEMLQCHQIISEFEKKKNPGAVYTKEEQRKRIFRYHALLKHLYQDYGESWLPQDSILWNCSQRTYHLESELIAAERKNVAMTQAALAEGIYQNPKEIAKIECGKSSPRQKRFRLIMEKLKMNRGRRSGFVITDSCRAMCLRREIQGLGNRHQYDEMRARLAELESLLDMRIPENQQVVQGLYNIVAFKTGERKTEELLKEDWELLQKTYHISVEDIIQKETDGFPPKKKRGRPKKEKVILPYFYRVPFKSEADLLNHIAIMLESVGHSEEAIRLYEKLVATVENSKIRLEFRYFTYSLLLGNLAKDKCSVMDAEKVIRYCLRCGKMGSLGNAYLTIACALIDDSSNRERCREMIKECFYLFELSGNYVNRKAIGNYYASEFGDEIALTMPDYFTKYGNTP